MRKLSKKNLTDIENYRKVSICLQIPSKYSDQFDEYEKKVEKLTKKFGGELTTDGSTVFFTQHVNNIETARKFIVAFRKMFPRYLVDLVVIEALGSEWAYSNRPKRWNLPHLGELKPINQFMSE